jgi:hypothetical protein
LRNCGSRFLYFFDDGCKVWLFCLQITAAELFPPFYRHMVMLISSVSKVIMLNCSDIFEQIEIYPETAIPLLLVFLRF